MDMNVIREYLISNNAIHALVGDNIFLYEKPEKVKADTYILYSFKELNGGSVIRDYQLDLHIVGKDKLRLFDVKDNVIETLDNFNKPTKIKDSTVTIRHTKLINGGGIAKNQESGEYYLFVYFLVRV